MASKTFAAGARVPFIKTGVGAIASQAKGNQLYGPRGLALLAAGASAADTVRLLIAADEDQDIRQVHVMDRQGRFAAHTGAECLEWCGHLVKPTFSLAGNILAGAGVLEAMAAAYEAGAELPFAQRLIAALQGGRGGRRRQARAAVGGAADPRRQGVGAAQYPGRRPRRSAGRARAPGGGRARGVDGHRS